MTTKLAVAIAITAIVLISGIAFAWANASPISKDFIVCPKDDSPYVLTPIGTKSENFLWHCLSCGYQWTRTHPEEVYNSWRDKYLEPEFVRDYALLYLKAIIGLKVPDFLSLNWTSSRQIPQGIVGYEDYVYKANGITVEVSYPVVLAENIVYKIKVEQAYVAVWQGALHSREFLRTLLPQQNDLRPVYEYYGGVGVFTRGIHVIATDQNPLGYRTNFQTVNDYWKFLKEKETVKVSQKDFISIIIARGDYPTGGYVIQIKSFSWLESYPVKLRFEVNFTNPGEGVAVTEAFTNPLVLIPIGKLTPGEYVVEVHIDTYILTYDSQGKPVYKLLLTFKEELWTQKFTVE